VNPPDLKRVVVIVRLPSFVTLGIFRVKSKSPSLVLTPATASVTMSFACLLPLNNPVIQSHTPDTNPPTVFYISEKNDIIGCSLL
jgi:hypothetical protein